MNQLFETAGDPDGAGRFPGTTVQPLRSSLPFPHAATGARKSKSPETPEWLEIPLVQWLAKGRFRWFPLVSDKNLKFFLPQGNYRKILETGGQAHSGPLLGTTYREAIVLCRASESWRAWEANFRVTREKKHLSRIQSPRLLQLRDSGRGGELLRDRAANRRGDQSGAVGVRMDVIREKVTLSAERGEAVN
jgi:hypothetical protein